MSHVSGFLPKKYLFKEGSQKFSPIFSSKSLIVLGFMFRFMIHLELIFVCGTSYKLKFVFCKWISKFPAAVVEKYYLFSTGLALHIYQRSVVHI